MKLNGSQKITPTRKAVFLDRDGVINRAIVREGRPFPPTHIDELEILPGVYDALLRLQAANYLLIVISNQPDVARGGVKEEDVERINKYLYSKLPIDDIKVCYHDDGDKCFCRKPLPGALFKAASEFGIDLQRSFMVGDRWRDIEAGKRANCKTFFINYSYKEKMLNAPDFTVTSLLDAVNIILREF